MRVRVQGCAANAADMQAQLPLCPKRVFGHLCILVCPPHGTHMLLFQRFMSMCIPLLLVLESEQHAQLVLVLHP